MPSLRTPILTHTKQRRGIISRDGGVTLRGPVKSEDEKQLIDSIAKKLAGAAKVDNKLELAPSK